MSAPEGKTRITVVTACLSADGTPDFALNEIDVTHEEYENGVHYLLAEEQLAKQGYEEPFLHFDEREAPHFLVAAVKQYLAVPDPITNNPPEEP